MSDGLAIAKRSTGRILMTYPRAVNTLGAANLSVLEALV